MTYLKISTCLNVKIEIFKIDFRECKRKHSFKSTCPTGICACPRAIRQCNVLSPETQYQFSGLGQYCSNSSANALELPQSVTKLLSQKITIPISRLVLQNFALPGCFPYILSCQYLFSLLCSVWFVFAVCDSISVRELVGFNIFIDSQRTVVRLLTPLGVGGPWSLKTPLHMCQWVSVRNT